MIGSVAGTFTIVDADPTHERRWIGRCKCGIERSFPEHRLSKDKSIYCKCHGHGRARHGMSYEPIYAVWNSMKVRCQNPNMHAYGRYGGRGIKVCERWQDFENFLADMGPTYQPGLSLERNDNNGNYEPSNCFWATMAQQNRNQERNVYIDTCRGRMTMQDAAKLAGITWRGMWYRVTSGKTGEALFAPNNKGYGRPKKSAA